MRKLVLVGSGAAAMSFFTGTMLMAQEGRQNDVVALKNWAVPLYWQPTPAEAEAATAKPNTIRQAQTPLTPLVFVGMTPCRVVDTRVGFGFTGAFGPPSLAGGIPRTIPIQSSSTCTIPSTALAYSLNVTVVPPGPLGLFLTTWPTGQARPLAATLNAQGQIVGNAAIALAGTSGSLDVYASNPTELVIDINGYFMAQQGSTVYTIAWDQYGALLKRNSTDISVYRASQGIYYVTVPNDQFICAASFGPPTFNYANFVSVDYDGNTVIVSTWYSVGYPSYSAGHFDHALNLVCGR